MSGGNGSLVRDCARSRSLREVVENSRLRFGFGGCGAAASTAGSASGARSCAASSCHGGGAGGSALPTLGAPGWPNSAPLSAGAPSRTAPGGSTGRTVISPRGSGIPAPSRRPMIFSSRIAIQRAIMIAPEQTPSAPIRISVLPKLNSLTGTPKPIASRPAKTRPIPATNTPIAIEPTPAAAPEMLAVRHCHDTVILCASPTGNCAQSSAMPAFRVPQFDESHGAADLSFSLRSHPPPYFYHLPIAAILLHCIRKFRPQFPITC